MEKKRLFILAGTIIIVVFGIVLFLSLTEPPVPSNVKVSYTTPVETPTPKKNESAEKEIPDIISSAGESAASLVNPASGQITEPSTVIPLSESPERFVLHIQDALGEPIVSGVIFAGTKEYKFTKGQLPVTDSWAAGITVTVSADGYASAQKVINPEDASTHTITMEYVSSYQIAVGNNDGSAVTDSILVRIWKGDSPPRPIRNNTTVVTTKYGYDLTQTSFGLQQNRCLVTQGLLYPHKKNFDTRTDGSSSKGDILLALGNCAWSLNPLSALDKHQSSNFDWLSKDFVPISIAQSSNLRIWDTLYLAQQKDANSLTLCKEKCEVQRNSIPGYYFVAFPVLPADSQILCELKTDKNGKCRIDNLPPALYCAQAYKEDQTSLVVPMHPSCGGANLRMNNQSHVFVWVRREGLEYKDFNRACVNGAEILLKAIEGQAGFYSAVTAHGRVEFDKVPYGKYHLTAIPLDGQRFEKDVLIQKPEERVDVSISGWEKYTVTGILIDAETEKPIPGYELVLDDINTKEVAITGEDGRFAFPDTPVGMYQISLDLSTFNNYKYLPEKNDFAISSQRLFPVAKASVPGPGPSYENIVIRLHKSQETKFSGRVLTQDKKPVAGAAIAVSFESSPSAVIWKLCSFPIDAVSDQNGYFSVIVICGQKANDTQGAFEITAIDGVQNIPALDTNNKWTDKELETMNVGSLSIEGKVGQTYENLQIVLQGKKDKILYGHLKVDEDDFKGIQISAVQNTFWKMGKIANKDFTITNLAPGDFILNIIPSWKSEVETPLETKTIEKYKAETIKLNMPDDQKEMQVDIKLRKNAYLMGWASVNSGEPLRSVGVTALRENEEDSQISGDTTNNKGFFFIDGLSSNEYYRLRFSRGEEDKEIYRSDPFMPGTNEIKIEVKQ